MADDDLPPRFKRAGGLNRSERILTALADQSFLSLWTYPNLFMKQNNELTDLLVMFGDHVLIFSDKAVAYPRSDRPDLDWTRFYRRAISDSAKQINRAEGWLNRFPDQIFLDARCQERLPVTLPPVSRRKVHRICVAPAAAEAASIHAKLPGLRIRPSVVGDEEAFTIGQVTECKGWVHVFDEVSLRDLLQELSTTPDFIAYLDAKEQLMSAGGLSEAATESDLLATYILNERGFPIEGWPLTAAPGTWEGLRAHPQYRAGRALDEVANAWDFLIEKVTDLHIARQLVVGNDVGTAQFEAMMRVMASESRFARRVMARAILERAHDAIGGKISRLIASPSQAGVYYVLLIADHDPRLSYEVYREQRRDELACRLQALHAARPDCQIAMGIAMDAPNESGAISEDFLYADMRDWDAEDLAQAKAIQAEFNYFNSSSAQFSHLVEDEYPDLAGL